MDPADNKRRSPRMRTMKGASVILPGSASAFSCVMRNLSEHGALVELPSTIGIPGAVILQTQDGTLNRHCRVVWRTEVRLGLEFTD
ncbi:hypothetical protein IZ6_11630 [Terrihabitans soli]|uniref:PilZ domain-containing protein n=1 Tax=Terrihabitans soli TaxID=708113 RepID=A0A6S6QV94_9HYPH|nr:PilZ domain-containing protein [Terrihabitans soli]BCJ90428.1 hypothetical protein IZ6_11630 [Terrihabitans soli]